MTFHDSPTDIPDPEVVSKAERYVLYSCLEFKAKRLMGARIPHWAGGDDFTPGRGDLASCQRPHLRLITGWRTDERPEGRCFWPSLHDPAAGGTAHTVIGSRGSYRIAPQAVVRCMGVPLILL